MKVNDQGPVSIDTVRPVKDGGGLFSPQEPKKVKQPAEIVRVSFSEGARRLQKVAALAKKGEDLRADRVRRLKEEIEQGTFRVEAADVAKALLRSEVSRLLGGKTHTPKP